MATSVGRPVSCEAPCAKLVVIAPMRVPRPTWAGLVPPAAPAGAAAPEIIWLRVSWNTAWLDLKPAVLTLAMLLPTTSIIVWCDRRPETAEKSERSMRVLQGSQEAGLAEADGAEICV